MKAQYVYCETRTENLEGHIILIKFILLNVTGQFITLWLLQYGQIIIKNYLMFT